MSKGIFKMNGDYTSWDRAFIRVKDFILVATMIGGGLLWAFNFIGIPKQVIALEDKMEDVEKKGQDDALTLGLLKKDMEYVKEQQAKMDKKIDVLISRPV